MRSAPRVYWLTEEYPPETGGTGVIAARLCEGLAARGIETRVITRQTRPARAREEWLNGVHVRRIQPAGRMKGVGWRAVPAMLGYLARLSALLGKEARRYDIVVVSSMKVIPLAAVPACRLLGKVCVVRLESPFELVEPITAESRGAMGLAAGRWVSRVLGALQRAVLTRAHCIVAISCDLESRLRRARCSAARIVRIPNATDLSRFKPATREEKGDLRRRLGIPADRTIVLYAGRLSRAKGVLMLIEGWRELSGRFPDLHLLLVGGGKGSWDDCEEEARRLVHAHRLTERVSFAGQSDRVHEYMQCADVYVCPSDYEGFSLAIAEALACALPVVVTAVGAAPEIIEPGVSGFLFPPKDRQAMVEALAACLGERARWPEISRRARESAEPFDLARVADRYAALCRELALARAAAAPPAAPRGRLQGSSSGTRARR